MAKDFTKGNPMKVILMFAMPMLIGNMFQQLYSTVDSIIVGNYVGKHALAAVSGSQSVQFLILALALGFGAGMSVVIAQVYGAKDYDKLRKAFSTGAIFIIGMSFLLGAFGYFIAEPTLKLMGTPPEILEGATIYLQIMFIGMPSMFLYNMYASVLRAIGDSKTPLYFLIVATVVNIVLDYVFVVYCNMGVAGVAIATVIAQLLSGVLSYFYVNKKVPVLRLHKQDIVFDMDIFKATVRYGLPAALQQSIISISFMAVQSFVNFFGSDMMTAFGIVNRIESFVTMPMMNLAMALSMYAGQNIGAGRVDRAKQGVKASLIMQVVFCGVMAILLPFIAKFLIALFISPEETTVISIGVNAISLCAFFYIIFAAMQTFGQFLRGVGDASFTLLTSIFMILVRIPVTYLFVHILQWGEMSIWYGMLIAWAASMSMNGIRFLSGRWQGKAFVQKQPTTEVE